MNPKFMKKPIQLFFIGCVAAAMAGCSSAPSRFYTLNATAKGNGGSAVPCAVLVGPVFVPASVERPQFVVTTATNRVELEEFNRWAAPLGESIARVISTDLGVMLGTSRAASAPVPNFGPAYQVTIRIERFESALGGGKMAGEALVDAVWTIRNPSATSVDTGHTVAREPARGSDFEALAAAHSRALARVSSDIAVAIRMAETEKK
jgi:uncharacterized lipoprotein YmbA